MEAFNIYCDESTHIESDGMPYLVLGGISCPTGESKEISKRIHEIKRAHGLAHDFEIKWTKVSPAKLEFYLDLINYFFEEDDLSFRCVVAPKGQLDHVRFNQTHDEWYYKMMFYLLRGLVTPKSLTYIYIDKKETQSRAKIDKLQEVLAYNQHDFNRELIRRVQVVESHHVTQLQLADLLLGAVNYENRRLNTSPAKLRLVKEIQDLSKFPLTKSTDLTELKFNLFHWKPQGSY